MVPLKNIFLFSLIQCSFVSNSETTNLLQCPFSPWTSFPHSKAYNNGKRHSFMQEKYLLPSPDVSPEKPAFPLLTESATVKAEDQWPSGSSELLTGLTDDNRKLVGYMVPWDPWIYQQLFNPTAGGAKVGNPCRICGLLVRCPE